MRIGMILDHEFPPDMRVENEALSLVKSGHKVTLLSYNFSNLLSNEKYKDIEIKRININKKYADKFKYQDNFLNAMRMYLKKYKALNKLNRL